MIVSALFAVMIASGVISGLAVQANAPEKEQKTTAIEQGGELFAREWLPNDSRSHGGDGLGPVFNDTSCIACHNQGGAGGAGPLTKNVDIISASSPFDFTVEIAEPSVAGRFFRGVFGLDSEQHEQATQEAAEARRKMARQQQAKVHPGFGTAGSVVLHRFGTDPNYAQWRQKMAGGFHLAARDSFFNSLPQVGEESIGIPGDLREFQRIQRANKHIEQVKAESGITTFTRTTFHDGVTVSTTQRNPIALFGAGLIDSIPDKAIEEAAQREQKEFPEIQGRVCRLKDGRIGRFGWKAQKASLYDFAMTACAVELGLHVPDHPQAGVPLQPDYKPTGLDMNQTECDALVAYLKVLPTPVEQRPGNEAEVKYLAEGRKLFSSVGCAACHTPRLGEVDGLYSDLLLHDMGEDMVDTGDYGVFIPSSPPSSDEPEVIQLEQIAGTENGDAAPKMAQIAGAKRVEWRTPPLWGVRDSSPYLHDGRAQTLQQAIAFHGGEAKETAVRFFTLPAEKQVQVLAFLKSLTAPAQAVAAQKQRLVSQRSR